MNKLERVIITIGLILMAVFVAVFIFFTATKTGRQYIDFDGNMYSKTSSEYMVKEDTVATNSNNQAK